MKKIINYFIQYHVAVNVFILAFVLFGLLGVNSLKSSFFPLTESHIIQITVAYPGASPQEIEEGVVLKIEDNLKGLAGVERVTSVSRENGGSITVEVEKEEKHRHHKGITCKILQPCLEANIRQILHGCPKSRERKW